MTSGAPSQLAHYIMASGLLSAMTEATSVDGVSGNWKRLGSMDIAEVTSATAVIDVM